MTGLARPRIARATSILDYIGNTPLIRLQKLAGVPAAVELYAKAEQLNPGGSVKDRPALNMILDGEQTGKLVPGKIIIDSTSGNTGIAYAMIGAAKGYRVQLCLPANASLERKRILRAYGADVILTDPGEGSDGAIRRCRELYFSSPDKYFYPDQYNNPANWLAHYETTGKEILHQTDGRVTHFVAGLGTSGTFMGVGRRLREFSPKVRLISMQPASGFHGLEGLKHMPTAIVPGIYDPALADENLNIHTEEAYEMVKRLAVEEGLLVGISSGGNIAAARKVAMGLERGVVVTIIADGADKYLSEHFWEE
ncbi:MAG TPA: cysteine synthase family protein [Bryobacterales bacterium]|nr:cysteine synthase family protein [Bryobacterales bacterium]